MTWCMLLVDDIILLGKNTKFVHATLEGWREALVK